MGIRGGTKDFITSNLIGIPNSGVQRVSLTIFRGKTIAIDWANISYRFLSRSTNITEFKNEFINLVHKFARYGIKLIFVFDGNPGEKKNKILKLRKNIREKIIKKIGDVIENVSNLEEDFNTIVHLAKRLKTLKQHHIVECKKLFDVLGVKYIHLEDTEADCIFKLLLNYGIVDLCFSGDMDLLAFGCKKIILDLDFKADTVIEITIDQLCTHLGISQFQLLSAFVLSGTDWNTGIKKSTFQQNLELIKIYGDIPRVLDNLKEINCNLPEGKHIAIPNIFDWEFSISIYTEAFSTDVIHKIQSIIELQNAHFALMQKQESFNTIVDYGKYIIESDSNNKYTRKYQEYILWTYSVRLNLIPYLGQKQKALLSTDVKQKEKKPRT